MTEYIVFIHGVNTRTRTEQPDYAKELIRSIDEKLSNLKLKQIPLFWGDVGLPQENDLLEKLKESKAWNRMWFHDFRSNQLMQFVGDAALYISRHVGSKVVQRLAEQIKANLPEQPSPEDRLHLITHSWGTVILFDVLFAGRWDNPEIPAYRSVQAIRQGIFGVAPNAEHGITIASVHTMGSPIALFSLLDVQESGHDLTPKLEDFLKSLSKKLQEKKLPWRNYIHPGDPVAWPLDPLLFRLLKGVENCVDIKDVVTHNADLSDFLTQPFSQTFLALLHGGDAHGSYWTSQEVVKEITKTITQAPHSSVAV